MKKIAWYITATLWQILFFPIAILMVISAFLEFLIASIDAITKPINAYFLILMDKRHDKWWS